LGKSHIAEELANIMGVNAFEASFAGGTKDFLGENKKPGALLRAVTNQKGDPQLNSIAVLEELDRLLNEDKKAEGPALRILDPRAKELDFGYGMYDWSHHGQIVLMNHLPKCEAILDRLDIVQITGVVKENKEDILRSKILPEFLQSMSLTVADLPQEELQAIISSADKAGFRKQEEDLQNLCAKTWREKRSVKKVNNDLFDDL
jgi:ATP-dependent Lon protease